MITEYRAIVYTIHAMSYFRDWSALLKTVNYDSVDDFGAKLKPL